MFGTYESLLYHVWMYGDEREDRTGVGTKSLFGLSFSHDMKAGFPAVSTKKLFLRGVVEELAWMLRGETNVRSLQERGITIWDEWADDNGDLGPVYGAMWRRWPHQKRIQTQYGVGWDMREIDQISELIEGLRKNPDSRRHMVSAWNPALVSSQRLPPCHWAFQCYVRASRDGGAPELDLMWHQRSADLFLGFPFNIASYGVLLTLLAREVGMVPGKLIATLGDAHIYRNHYDQVKEQLTRAPLPLCKLSVSSDLKSLYDLSWDKVKFEGYEHHGPLQAPVAV